MLGHKPAESQTRDRTHSVWTVEFVALSKVVMLTMSWPQPRIFTACPQAWHFLPSGGARPHAVQYTPPLYAPKSSSDERLFAISCKAALLIKAGEQGRLQTVICVPEGPLVMSSSLIAETL